MWNAIFCLLPLRSETTRIYKDVSWFPRELTWKSLSLEIRVLTFSQLVWHGIRNAHPLQPWW